ncbi:MAG: NAD(P)-dependent oxidoreductase, partial [Acidobacteria bacterium]|nr:NAD(P)-dependent oxidoreductase [Acidobacteriota bacterium]
MNILVTGAAGHLGAAITAECARGHSVVALSHVDLDITRHADVRAVLDRERPDAIVNCAAYNDVDGAETSAVRALDVNAFGVRSLAAVARDVGAMFVHYGTDFVFDGAATQPYREEHEPNPQSVYASSKLLGEWFARDAPRHYVLRVESLFGEVAGSGHAERGSVGRIVAAIRDGVEAPVFTDRTVSPSAVDDVARATRELLEREAPPGLYHCVNSGQVTWYDFACEVARLLGVAPRLRRLTTEEAGLK